MRRAVVAATTALVLTPPAVVQGAPAVSARGLGVGTTVIAIVEPGGLNVLHSDFRATPGARLPKAVAERAVAVDLPSGGGFEQRLARAEDGLLGALRPGTLYHLRGTRLLVYPSPGRPTQNVFADPSHGTGVASSAAGAEHGTDPAAWIVYVLGTDEHAWSWLAEQRWIDVVSTSYYSVVGSGSQACPEAAHVERIVGRGGIVFSAAGNQEQVGAVHTPAGLPGVYQVGGVDAEGRTYLRPEAAPTDPSWASATPTRPYETGDRFRFVAADSESGTGSEMFGGTSGATPSTAGRATTLIRYARELLASKGTGTRRGALALAGAGARTPERGPLADGDLTAEELTWLLHRVAIPAEPATPARYLVEGFGALNRDAVRHAMDVLAGRRPVPPRRPDEEAMHDRFETLRTRLFAARCG